MLGLTLRQRQTALILLILLTVGGSLLMFRQAHPAAVEFPVAPAKPVYIHLTGAVRQPGIVQLTAGTRVFEALEKAGGALPEADLERINLAKFVIDGEQLYVPAKEDPAAQLSVFTQKKSSAVATETQAEVTGPLNLNRASQAELETVPGIGPALARRIIAYREAHGGFQTYEELDEVSGIGSSTLEKFRPFFITP